MARSRQQQALQVFDKVFAEVVSEFIWEVLGDFGEYLESWLVVFRAREVPLRDEEVDDVRIVCCQKGIL